jgi:hypothetical protein
MSFYLANGGILELGICWILKAQTSKNIPATKDGEDLTGEEEMIAVIPNSPILCKTPC